MKASTTLFTVSFLSAVAAGWYHLDASQEKDGPARKPALTRVTLDGNELAIGVDRERVPAGESVKLSLAMVSGKGGEVRVMVQEQSASFDSRMEPPARTISSQIVSVGEKEAVVPIDLAGILRPGDPDPLMTAGSATRYTVLVMSDTDGSATAAVPVFAYEPEAYQLTVDAPTAGGVGEPCDVTVHVKSLADKPLTGITIGLSTSFISTSDAPVVETLAAGDETTVTVHGTRLETTDDQPLLVQAYGYATYGGTAQAWATVDRDSGKLAQRASEPYSMLAFGY